MATIPQGVTYRIFFKIITVLFYQLIGKIFQPAIFAPNFATMKCIAMIPARYAATRFPAKLMQLLGNKTVIRHTYDNTVATGLFDQVMVVTDSQVIFEEITSNGGSAKMSVKEHESGSDRIAEAVEDIEVDIVINVQGDEPFVKKELSSTVGSEAWNSRDLKSRPH